MSIAATAPALRKIADLDGPKGWPILGNMFQAKLDTMHLQMESWCEQYGPLFRLRFGPIDAVCVADSDAINEILIERPDHYRRHRSIESIGDELQIKGVFGAEGEQWRKQRRIVAKALNSAHIHRVFPQIHETTRRLHERWQQHVQSQAKIDLCRELMRYTVDVTTQLAFGVNMNTLETDGPVVQQQLDKVFPMTWSRMNAPFPYWRYIKLPKDRELDRALEGVRETVTGFIEACRKRMAEDPTLYESPTNFLEAIIAAQREEGAEEFSDQDIYANVITLLLAGEDTTANTIAWTSKYFIDHPDVLARVRAEADAALGNEPFPESPAKLSDFPYLEACVHETMRLKPVGPLFSMEPVKDVELMGVAVPKGTPVLMLTRYIATEARNFRDPKSFDPERWLKSEHQASGPHTPKASIPFGTGPRFCPGRNLALTEIKMVLSMFARNFDMVLADPTIPVEEKLSFAMIPKNLDVRIHARSSK